MESEILMRRAARVERRKDQTLRPDPGVAVPAEAESSGCLSEVSVIPTLDIEYSLAPSYWHLLDIV